MAMEKPQAYTGNAPYIFISYAHKDKERVYPIIEGLQRRGLRVWYDEELGGGDDWLKKVARRLDGCTQVICVLSKNYINSKNCLDEISMAANEGKGPVPISLEEVKLPAELRLISTRINIIKRSEFNTLNDFVDKIALSEPLRPCCYDPSRLPVRKQSNPLPSRSAASYQRSSSGKGKIIGIAVAAVVVVALVLALVIPRLGGDTPDNPDLGGNGSSPTGQQLPKDPSDRYELALRYVSEGKYADAYEILKELGDYSDSASQMKSIREQALLQQIKKAQPGDIVYWGSYEQDAVTSNGAEDIAWVVLYDDNGRKLLLSQQCLDSQPYNEQNTPTSWAKSTLRTWLNDDFYWEAFNDAEQEALFLNTTKTDGSDDTRDYVTLLSMAEASLYLDLFAQTS